MSKLHEQIKLAEENYRRKHSLYMAQAVALAELELVVEQAKNDSAKAGAELTLLLQQEDETVSGLSNQQERKAHGTDRS